MDRFKTIPISRGQYQITQNGELRTRNYISKSGQRIKGRIIAQSLDRCGYKKVNLLGKNYFIHRLVCMTWMKDFDESKQVNHKNCVKIDNRLKNLEMCTNEENARHARKNGLISYTNNRPVLLKYGKDTKMFKSIKDCSKYLGNPYTTVYGWARNTYQAPHNIIINFI